MTLSSYVQKLAEVEKLIAQQNWPEAQSQVKLLQKQWLAVEGDVVSKSASVYNDAERDLVTLDAYLSSPDKQPQAAEVAKRLKVSLEPLADASYTWFDAALIPLREGLESLLVVGSLLMYAKRANSKQARQWIVGGVSAGVLLCIGAGLTITFVISAAAFGHNNSLINGFTGIFASLLLLYVSYWLHRNSDAKRWSKYIASKTTSALTGGRMFSLALLAFLAIVREGMETVLFLIGMAGRMSTSELVGGIAAGLGILVVIAIVMLKAGTRLPIKPFFIVSSIIVFYLCLKFMGSGIHSLQMAGLLPASANDYLPTYNGLSLYSSWYSTLPQLLLLATGLLVFVVRQYAGKRLKQS